MQETEGLFNNFDPRRGIGHLGPLIQRWTARITWEGDREGAADGVGGGDGSATMDNGVKLTGVARTSVTRLGFQIREHRGEAEEKANPMERIARAGMVTRGARHERWRA
jgi:hypothetical protein